LKDTSQAEIEAIPESSLNNDSFVTAEELTVHTLHSKSIIDDNDK
jgi:hypothetical protein